MSSLSRSAPTPLSLRTTAAAAAVQPSRNVTENNLEATEEKKKEKDDDEEELRTFVSKKICYDALFFAKLFKRSIFTTVLHEDEHVLIVSHICFIKRK